jgi:chromosome segregation ATPase
MSFIAITYGYNQYSIFNTNVSTYPLLDSIVSTCLDDVLNLLNSKLPAWEEQINSYNNEEEQSKKNIKKLETEKTNNDEKANESNKPKDALSNNDNSNNNKKNSVASNPKAATSKKIFFSIFSY